MAAAIRNEISKLSLFSRVLRLDANFSSLRKIQIGQNTLFSSCNKGTSQFTNGIATRRLTHFSKLHSVNSPSSQKVGCIRIFANLKSPISALKFEQVNLNQVRHLPTLNQIRRLKPRTKKKRPKKEIPRDKRILLGPQRKGVCVKLVVRTPKKPNSAQRKCAVLRLSNGKLITAYIPGEKGALQEHGVVLFEGGRVQDCPGIKYKIIRRKYDMN
eukprot:gene6230-6946_t